MLDEFLAQQRAAIVADWFDRIVDSYPRETARFLRSQQDRFANPVGAALRDEVGPIVDVVIGGEPGAALESALDRIIRIRAVQDMTPSQAVGFLFDLKRLVRERVEAADLDCSRELTAVEDRIDRVVGVAFDVYVACREQIFDIRVNEVRNRSLKMMERLNDWRARRDGIGEAEVADPH